MLESFNCDIVNCENGAHLKERSFVPRVSSGCCQQRAPHRALLHSGAWRLRRSKKSETTRAQKVSRETRGAPTPLPRDI